MDEKLLSTYAAALFENEERKLRYPALRKALKATAFLVVTGLLLSLLGACAPLTPRDAEYLRSQRSHRW